MLKTIRLPSAYLKKIKEWGYTVHLAQNGTEAWTKLTSVPAEIVVSDWMMPEMNGDERQLYMSHPVQGEIILKEIKFLEPIAELVRAHHEQFNGRGFPDGLSGKEIPILARIVAAAATYDNLVHKGNVNLEDIPDSLQRMRGYQLDPAIVDHLLEINLENIQEEEAKDYLEIVLDDLEEGMMLAKNIRMKSGAPVMPAHTEVTDYGIKKLKNYHGLACITDKVYVYKKSVRG